MIIMPKQKTDKPLTDKQKIRMLEQDIKEMQRDFKETFSVFDEEKPKKKKQKTTADYPCCGDNSCCCGIYLCEPFYLIYYAPVSAGANLYVEVTL